MRDRRLLNRLYYAYVLRLQTACDTAGDVNRVSLMAMRFLPPNFQTRRFYLNWIEQLERLGGHVFLPHVVELMYKRGRVPGAKILNTVIRTWTSPTERTMSERAEGLA